MSPLIYTLLQRGASQSGGASNRFSGFRHAGETVKTVPEGTPFPSTPLKWGVTEKAPVMPHSICETPSSIRVIREPIQSP